MYQQIESDINCTIIIKRSKFITNLIAVQSQDDAESKLLVLRKQYSDATHNCFAYIADERGNLARFSDDGEPQGTAGQPILERLKKSNLSKTLAVVTRYFGGIKLGAAGLVGAYSDAVSEAIGLSTIKQFYLSQSFHVIVDYSNLKAVTDSTARYRAKVLGTAYNQDITISIVVSVEDYEELVAKLIDSTRGQISIAKLDIGYTSY